MGVPNTTDDLIRRLGREGAIRALAGKKEEKTMYDAPKTSAPVATNQPSRELMSWADLRNAMAHLLAQAASLENDAKMRVYGLVGAAEEKDAPRQEEPDEQAVGLVRYLLFQVQAVEQYLEGIAESLSKLPYPGAS